MTAHDQIYPPKLMLFVRAHACVLIKRPHTSERGSVCRFIGAPRPLDAYFSPYQRTLIAPSMLEQIHVRTNIHKAFLMHTMFPPSPIFCSSIIHKNVAAQMGLTKTHVYTHYSFYIALGDMNNFYSSRGINTCGMHVKQTATPLHLRRYAHTHKAFPRRAVTDMPVQQRHSLYTRLSYCHA